MMIFYHSVIYHNDDLLHYTKNEIPHYKFLVNVTISTEIVDLVTFNEVSLIENLVFSIRVL